jgi:hypothetical protein
VLEEIRDLLRPAAADRRVEVAVGWSRASLRAPRDACTLLLLHVGVSAIDATPEGGRLELLPASDGEEVAIRFTGAPPAAVPSATGEAWPFTSAARGASDLLVARHLAAALGGEIALGGPDPGDLACTVRLPARPPNEPR